MKGTISLILLLMCIAANADTEGASDYLKLKWSELHTVINQFNSRRCFRTCSSPEDVYWNVQGAIVVSLSLSDYLEYMAKTYEDNPQQFIHNIHNNATLGVNDLDADNNHKISAEEYYTEMLCLGFGLDFITKQFEMLQTMDDGVPNYRFIYNWVDMMTNDLKADETIDLLKNVSSAYNDTNPISSPEI